MPKIVQAIPVEDELHEILAAAGDVTVVAPGSGREGFLAAAAGADGIVLRPDDPR